MSDLREIRFVPVPCALCGESRSRPLARVDRYVVPLSIVRCRKCRHVYLDPRPADEDLPNLYDEDYYSADDGGGQYRYVDDRSLPESASIRAGARLERVLELSRPGRLLEVGCSFGAFLIEAGKLGFTPEGVDLSPYAVASCRKRGLPVTEGSLETADLPAGSFDVVYLSETVEHLPDPRRTLSAASRVLGPGGLAVLGTANHDSLARLLRGEAWGYYMPGHLQYFSAGSLVRLLDEVGFDAVRVRFGDDRRLSALSAARRAAGSPSGLLPLFRDVLSRLHLGRFSAGAGMVLYARRRS